MHHFVAAPLAVVTAVTFANACCVESDPVKNESLATRRNAVATLADHRNVSFLFTEKWLGKTEQWNKWKLRVQR